MELTWPYEKRFPAMQELLAWHSKTIFGLVKENGISSFFVAGVMISDNFMPILIIVIAMNECVRLHINRKIIPNMATFFIPVELLSPF